MPKGLAACALLVGLLVLAPAVEAAEQNSTAAAAERSGGSRHYRVLILGAGAAGIFAGAKLQEAGVTNFAILEGSDSVGGRIKHTKLSGRTIEQGAQWVAGTKGSQLWRLVRKYGIQGELSDFDDWIVFDKKGRVPGSELRWGRLSKALDGVDEIAEKLQAHPSAADLTTKASLALSGWTPRNKYDRAIEWSEVEYETIGSAKAISTRLSWPLAAYTDFKDQDYYVTDPRGYNDVLIQYAKDALISDKIVLNKLVVAIEETGGGVTVHLGNGDSPTADYVIVTFSLGVLQRNAVRFVPALPGWKQAEIQRLNMGVYDRICLSFAEQFWRDTEFFQYADDLKGYYPVWHNLNSDNAFGKGPPHIICVTVTDEMARMVESQPKSATVAQALEVLSIMFPRETVPEPLAVDIPKWGSDPLFYGSYSDPFPPGATPASQALVCAPLGRVFFAGEVCSRYAGWIHGAIDSGEETAKALLECLGKPEDCPDRSKPALGCTDPAAANYNPGAVIDDGSCVSTGDLSRSMNLCFGHTAVLSTEGGWPGLCAGLTWRWGAWFPGSAEACRSKCELDPSCGVWQVDQAGACYTGVGNRCLTRWGTSALAQPVAVSAAGMIQHGAVDVIASLAGLEVPGLRQVEQASEPEGMAVDNCRGICGSNQHCRYWQYGAAGCFVEDPAAGYAVNASLDLSELSTTSSYAEGVKAGEKIEHSCAPPAPAPERKDALPGAALRGAAPRRVLAAFAATPALLAGVALAALGARRCAATQGAPGRRLLAPATPAAVE